MQNQKIKKSIESKLFLIKCYLHTIFLRSGSDPDSILKHGVTGYYLHTVVLELMVKTLFEISKEQAAPFHHNILNIYGQIDPETQTFVESKYNEAKEKKELFLKHGGLKLKGLEECQVAGQVIREPTKGVVELETSPLEHKPSTVQSLADPMQRR